MTRPCRYINVRKLLGTHRHRYSPEMWMDTRRPLRRVRVCMTEMGLSYGYRHHFLGRELSFDVLVPGWKIGKSRLQWRRMLGREIWAARRQMRMFTREYLASLYGIKIESPIERYARERAIYAAGWNRGLLPTRDAHHWPNL